VKDFGSLKAQKGLKQVALRVGREYGTPEERLHVINIILMEPSDKGISTIDFQI
jgi:hypothetical protein